MAVSIVQHEIDTAKIPLVGLEFITEKQRRGLQPMYSCTLCEEDNIIYHQSGSIICHIIHDEHRRNYVKLKEGNLDEYEELVITMGKIQGSRYLSEKTQELESKYGREKINVEEIRPSASVNPMPQGGDMEFYDQYEEQNKFDDYRDEEEPLLDDKGEPLFKPSDKKWCPEEFSDEPNKKEEEEDVFDNFKKSRKSFVKQNYSVQNPKYGSSFSEFAISQFEERKRFNDCMSLREHFDNEKRPMSYVNPMLKDDRSQMEYQKQNKYDYGINPMLKDDRSQMEYQKQNKYDYGINPMLKADLSQMKYQEQKTFDYGMYPMLKDDISRMKYHDQKTFDYGMNPMLQDNISQMKYQKQKRFDYGMDSKEYYMGNKRNPVPYVIQNQTAAGNQQYGENFRQKELMKQQGNDFINYRGRKESNKQAFDPRYTCNYMHLSMLERLKMLEAFLNFIVTTDQEASLAEKISDSLKKKLAHYKIQNLPPQVEKTLTKNLKGDNLLDNILKLENLQYLKQSVNAKSTPCLPKPTG